MISNQCRAQCRCSHCEHNPASTQRTLAIGGKKFTTCDTNGTMKASSLSKDEMYMKYLRDTLNKRALMVSSKNATKFIPDEQIVSSLRKREEKEIAIASKQFPLRRRDRLEELLILEHKMRLKEEARLRKERLKLGIHDDNERAMVDGEVCDFGKDASTQVPISPDQNDLGGRATPPSRCSAEHDLNETLREIKGILEEEADAPPGKELSRHHHFKLHQLVQRHDKKSREQQKICPQQPHLCNHCFDVEVQARHLCPSASLGSVAYKETGKVINPEEGIRIGTDSQRGPEGTYKADNVTRFMASNMRLRDYNPHPYGTGVVFMPLSATANHGDTKSKTNGNRVKFEPTFNNNIAPEEPVASELQYPGSTYNVYDEPILSGKGTQDATGTITSVKHYAADPDNNATEHSNIAHRNEAEAKTVGDKVKLNGKSSSSYWLTTNQARDMDMERFLRFQRTLKDNSRKVYESTAPRNAVGIGLS